MTRGFTAALVAAFAALLSATVALAGEGIGRPHRSWLLGDWDGHRTRLQDQGVDFQLSYVSESAWNAAGGIRNVVDYTGQVTVGTTLDLAKLVGLSDATFQVTYTQRAGRDLDSDAALDTLQSVQEVYGRGQPGRQHLERQHPGAGPEDRRHLLSILYFPDAMHRITHCV